VLFFFVAALVVGLALYPRELFLGYIYEGQSDLQQSITHYREFLTQHPQSSFAVTRLAELYIREAQPDAATILYQHFMEQRPNDWASADRYLRHLESLHDQATLSHESVRLAKRFAGKRAVDQHRLVELLEQAFAYARWHQRQSDAAEILALLIRLAPHNASYREEQEYLEWGWHRTEAITQRLREQIALHPEDDTARESLVSVLRVHQHTDDALALIHEALQQSPQSLRWQRAQMEAHEAQGNTKAVCEDLQQLLARTDLDRTLQHDLQEHLASTYLRVKNFDAALALYQELRDADPAQAQRWFPVLEVLGILHRTDAVIAELTQYLQRFPQDLLRARDLIDVWLYVKKDLRAVPQYLRWVRSHHDRTIALDVAHLLIERHQLAAAQQWLDTVQPLFANDRAVTQLAMSTATAAGDQAKMLRIGTAYLAAHPRDAELQLFIGKELLFAAQLEASFPYLTAAHTLTPENAESAFWLMEWSAAKNQTAPMHDFAREVLKQQATLPPADATRMILKARARLAWTAETRAAYVSARHATPHDFELRADEMEMLLQHGERTSATARLQDMRAQFPHESTRLHDFETELAIANGDWRTALRWYERLLPHLASPYKGEERQHIQRSLHDLHAQYDTRATLEYAIENLGAPQLQHWRAQYQQYLGLAWQLRSTTHVTRADDNTLGVHAAAWEQEIALHFQHTPRASFTGSIAVAHSDQHTLLVTPGVAVELTPHEKFHCTAALRWHELRTDHPQALANGARDDSAHAECQFQPWHRVQIAPLIDYHHTRLSSGDTADTLTLEPALAFTVWRKPALTVGYQLAWRHLVDHGAFLTQFPLVPRIHAHYLTAALSHQYRDRAAFAASAFIGEDTARQLHFLEGQLWGASAHALIALTPWLDADAQYSYGRETATAFAGVYHAGHIGLQGHWQ